MIFFSLLNATAHHFVERQHLGGVQRAFNSMKLNQGLPSTPFARNIPKKPTSDLLKNLEILSFPSFRLLFCLPGRTRRSCRIGWDEKKLYRLKYFQISETKRGKQEREREREREIYLERCVGVRLCVCLCGAWGGMISCHFIISLLAANPITFPFPFYLGR